MKWWEAPEYDRNPMKFSDRSRSQTIRVRKTGCQGGPECHCDNTRLYAERPYRAEVKCERPAPDGG